MKFVWQGEKLKVRRKMLGLTLDQLAELVGTKRPHCCMWQENKAEPVGRYLLALADALKCDPREFYDAKEGS